MSSSSSTVEALGANVDWSQFPAMLPPPGVVPNFIDPYSERSSIWITSAICSTVATVAVFARLYTKACLVKVLHLEDYLLAAAWISFMVGVPFFCLEAWQGAGTHQWDVTVAQSLELMRLVNIGEATYCLNVIFAKLAILLQMKRVLAGQRKNLVYWLTIILTWIVLAFYSAGFFMVIFACIPREKIWQPWLKGTCMNSILGDFIAGSFNLATDILMLLLPIFAIFKLGIALKQRLLVSAVFSTGILACVFSALRVHYGHALLIAADRTYASIAASCVSMGEGTALTIIVCFPTIRLLILHLLGKQRIEPAARARETKQASLQSLRDKGASPVSMATDSDVERSVSSLTRAEPVYNGNKW